MKHKCSASESVFKASMQAVSSSCAWQVCLYSQNALKHLWWCRWSDWKGASDKHRMDTMACECQYLSHACQSEHIINHVGAESTLDAYEP